MPVIACTRFLCLAVAGGFALGLHGAEQKTLPVSSPFAPPAVAGAAPAGPAEQYEFAGVSTISGKSNINIYDKAAKKGRWIAVGETSDNISVVSYDADAERVVARINGAEKTLTLRKSSVATTTTAAFVPVPMPAPAPQPVAINSSSGVTYTVNNASGAIQIAATPPGAPLPPGVPAPASAPGPVPENTPAAKQEPPPQIGTVAYQEQEARMLVSDLMEIGIAQRRAYEAAQRKAVDEATAQHPSGQPQPTPQAR